MQSKRFKGVLHTHFEVGCFLVPIASIGSLPCFIVADVGTESVSVSEPVLQHIVENWVQGFDSKEAAIHYSVFNGDYFDVEFTGTIRLRNSRTEWKEYFKNFGAIARGDSMFISEVHEVHSVDRTKKNRFWIALQKTLSPLCWF